MLEKKEIIRKYKEKDKTKIIDLYREIFGKELSTKLWKWQYSDNVYGKGWINLIEVDDQIVAHVSVVRVMVNFLGRAIYAGHGCGAMVRSDQREKGWLTKLSSLTFKEASDEGAKAIFAFTNRASTPGFLRNDDGHKIAHLKHFYYRIGYNKLFGSISDKILKLLFRYVNWFVYNYYFKKFKGDVKVVLSKKLPDTLNHALREILNNEVLCIWKDLPYLIWRYQEHPENQYNFHMLYCKGKPEGVVVSREREDTIIICELLQRKKDIVQTTMMLRYVLYFYSKKPNIRKVEFYGYDSGYFDTVFSLSGFKTAQTSPSLFVGKPFMDKKLEKRFLLPHNWSITVGDSDVI